MRYIALLLLLFSGHILAEDLPSMEDFMVENYEKNLCSNNEYIQCMGISHDTCSIAFRHAFRQCMDQKSVDSPAPSPVCITNNYINRLDVNDSIVKSCEYIAARIAEDFKNKHMPNKSLNTDAQNARAR